MRFSATLILGEEDLNERGREVLDEFLHHPEKTLKLKLGKDCFVEEAAKHWDVVGEVVFLFKATDLDWETYVKIALKKADYIPDGRA